MNTKTYETALTVNKEKMKIHLTIDFDGLSDEEMQELAARSIIIRWQNEQRSDGVVPDTRTEIKAVDYALGRPRRPMDPMKALESLSAEQLQALLVKKGLA